MPKKMIHDFYRMKQAREKITWITAYDYPTAQFAEAAGVDTILVGDSLGMCVYGYPTTLPVTMEQCIAHCEAVRRGAPNTFLLGDMPFMSYQSSVEKAIENAGRFLQEAGADAVKLEGGQRVLPMVRGILDAGIVVCGHIGLTPQSSGQLGGHRAQGRTVESARALIEDALALEAAGTHLLLLEAIPPEVGQFIAERLSLPVISIGAGLHCDGQLLIVSDLLGEFQTFVAKFVRQYCNLAQITTKAIAQYCAEVRRGDFPAEEHCYHMLEGEYPKFLEMLKQYQRPQ